MRQKSEMPPKKSKTGKTGIPLDIQKKYIQFSEKHIDARLLPQDIETAGKMLFEPDMPDEKKREFLIRLAHAGTQEAVEILERFGTTQTGELKAWGVLALEECRMFMDSNEGKSAELIMSGLGGDGVRLRPFFYHCG